MLHERGYSALSVADLCADAGLKKGSFYHFFASKQELVLATIDRYGERIRQRQCDARQCGVSAAERLQFLIRQMEADMRQSRAECGSVRGCPLGNLALEMADQDEAIRRKVLELLGVWQQGLEDLLRLGVERGEFSVVDPKETSKRLLAFLEGSTLLAKAANDPGVFEELWRGILASLCGPPPTAASPSAGTEGAGASPQALPSGDII